ncbi:MAG: C-GCAxxG-C-C family protein [Saccharofermentanales bacterium]
MNSYSKKAMKLFKEGYNCSQSVVGAFCDDIGIDLETALKMSSSFGGGMGRLREVCGALTGVFIIAGIKYGYNDPQDDEAKAKHYQIIQDFAALFKDKNGSIICRELLDLQEGFDIPIPAKRTDEYYLTRPCIELVGYAAEILSDFMKLHSAG